MKKISITILLLAGAAYVHAQTRKDVANFSLFQQYFNPALTGYEGSIIKTYYRDQWSGFENAPRTFFISGELDLQSWKNRMAPEAALEVIPKGAKHAFGISYLHDTFGPLVESQLYLNYGSRVQLTEALSLRAGGTITYNSQRIDGSRITLDQQNDASLQEFMNSNAPARRLDFNIGLMVTGEDFYAGYALQDAARGGLTSGEDFLKNSRSHQHIIQAGYRRAVNDRIGVIANSLLRYDSNLGETIEGQLKGVFYNAGWVGFGYRHKLAYSINLGVRVQQFKIGFVRELPTGNARNISTGTNEIILTYDLLSGNHSAQMKKLTMW